MSTSDARMLSSVRELVGAEVLVIDQDERVQRGLVQLLSAASLHVTCADTPEAGLDHLARRFFSVVIVDLDTPTPSAGLETIALVAEKSPTSMIMCLTPRKAFDDAVAAIRAGAIDIIRKTPESVPHLKDRVMEAAGRSAGKREVSSLLGEIAGVWEDLLKQFMGAERRALDLSDRLAGRDPDRAVSIDEIRVLVVAQDPALGDWLAAHKPAGYAFQNAVSGGQALDRVGVYPFHYVMIADDLQDLPSTMVVRSVRTQQPEAVILAVSGPRPGGSVDLVDTTRVTPILEDFTAPEQLLERLDELAEAFRVKSRERRYMQAFRERHYDFLRRYVELKSKIERALAEDSKA